jgi:predicted MFS family arabinose efflux permease
MVTQCHRESERNTVQAFNDFMVFGAVALASFSSGKLLASVGWTMVNEVVFPILLLAGVLVLWSLLRARPAVQG